MKKRVTLLDVFTFFVGLTVLSGCGSSYNQMTTTPPPDFALNISAQSVFVPIGNGSSSLQLSVRSINSFNQAVTISVTGLPAGMSLTPHSPFTINAGASQKIVFNATNGMQPSLQQVSFQAAAGALSHSSPISISVARPVYAYIANGSPGNPPNNLGGYGVDANTGAVWALQGSPTTLPNSPSDIAVASETGGTFVFTLTSDGTSLGAHTLSNFKVDPGTGSLTLMQTINYPSGGNQWFMAVHPTGKFLYVPQPLCTAAYLIDPATGNLSQSSCSTGGLLPGFSPTGNFAYGQDAASLSLINTYSVSLDGSLTFLQSQALGLGLVGITFVTDPLGQALYGTAPQLGLTWPCGFLLAWTIDPQTGSLTKVYDSFLDTSFGPLCFPMAPSFAPTNQYVYVANRGKNLTTMVSGIFGAAVDAATGNLTNVPGTPVATQSQLWPRTVLTEPSQGKFVIEVDGTDILSWAVDPTTGALSQGTGTGVPLTQTNPVKAVIVATPQ